MADWTCRCSAKNRDGDRYCEGCGAENPKRGPVPEAHAPARLPTYPEPTAEDDVARRAALEAIFALLGGRPVRAAPPRDLPPVDPAVRADLARRAAEPERVGEISQRARWWRPKRAL